MRLLLLGLLLATGAAAQPTGLYLTGGFARNRIDADRLALLGETYSAYYAARLDGDVQLLPSDADAFVVGATGRLNPGGFAAAFGYQYGRATFDATSEFEDGSGDHVATRTLDHAFWVELSFELGPLAVGGHAGGLARGTRIESATVYPDGSESLGSEYRLNGIYTASTSFLEAGPVVALQIGDRLLIPVRVLFPFEIDDTRLPALDFDTYQGNDSFPRDFDRFVVDSAGNDDGAAVSDRDFVGRRIVVGLELRLF